MDRGFADMANEAACQVKFTCKYPQIRHDALQPHFSHEFPELAFFHTQSVYFPAIKKSRKKLSSNDASPRYLLVVHCLQNLLTYQ